MMAVNMNMAVFWVIALCSLVEVHQRFRDAMIAQLQAFLKRR
jgi:hypothetical protein